MIIDNQLLDTLSAQAKASPRLRQAYDLRNPSTGSGQVQSEDKSQRMLNALEPGTVMPIHRHKKSSESIAIIRGKMVMRFYDDNGNVTDEFVMAPNSEYPMVQVEAGQWHSLEVLEEGTVVFEAKDGKYVSLADIDIMTMKKSETYMTETMQDKFKRIVNYNNKNCPVTEEEENVLFLVLDEDDVVNTAFNGEKRMLLEYDIYQPYPPTKCVYRLDPANNAVGQQEHLHVYADKKHKHQLYAINIDGTPHDGSKFKLNNKHQQALKNLGFPVPKDGLLEWLYLGDCRLLND